MVVKSFRGLLADGVLEKLNLSTNNGKTGYRIIKFEVIGGAPGAANYEAITTISKVSFTPSSEINFSDSNILGAAFYAGNAASFNYPTSQVIVFDGETFNQDIYIGLNDLQSNTMNYYLELETIPLTDQGAEFTTLKDIRANA
tara:strand:- start:94 stop:522 length:429 start_codon:yes stop_codon:yes gene_type:complete